MLQCFQGKTALGALFGYFQFSVAFVVTPPSRPEFLPKWGKDNVCKAKSSFTHFLGPIPSHFFLH